MVEEDLHIRRAVTDDAQLLSALSAVTFFDTFNGTCTDEDMQGFIKNVLIQSRFIKNWRI